METAPHKIVPHIWFDKEARNAVNFYISIFAGSEVISHTVIGGTPSGDVDIITYNLSGQKFIAINAGPLFKVNESTSFFVYCGSENEIDRLYKSLSDEGFVLMPLDRYPWTSKYAWVRDKFGVSWQLDIDDINSPQKIVPSLLFANDKSTRVKEAVNFYTSVFPNSRMIMESPWDSGAGMPEGSVLFAQYKLSGYLFNAMSSNLHHDFDFNEALSYMVYCKTQEEIDYYWDKLSSGGVEQPCGWVKDRFGVSWQVVPVEMEEMMTTADKKQLERVMGEMFKMYRLDIKKLRAAYSGK